jgi:uncharacterized repeat protein (TIGR01451 family)
VSCFEKVIDPGVDVVMTKTASPEPVYVGQNLTYSLTIRNDGPLTATLVTVADPIPTALEFVSASVSQGSCDCSPPVRFNLGAMARDAVVTATIVVTPKREGSVENRAHASTAEYDFNSSNNTGSVFSTILPSADLEVLKSASPEPVPVGQTLYYEVTVINHGPSDATDVTVVDSLPGTVTLDNAVVSMGSWTLSGSEISWDVGSLDVGEFAILNVEVRPTVVGTVINTATTSGNEHDPNSTNNMSSVESTVIASADLSITKSAFPEPVPIDQLVTYTLTITNNGPSPATQVCVADILPGSVLYVGSESSQGTCTHSGSTVKCAIGVLDPGTSVVVTVIVRPQSTGTVHNTASVTALESDPATGNNSATADTTVIPSADLAISKSASPDPVPIGELLTYTVSVMNRGPSAASAVTVTDPLPAGMTFASASSTQGSCSHSGGVVTCDLGQLALGAMTTVTITVEPQVEGVISNTAEVAAAEFDPEPCNNSATVDSEVIPGVDLAVSCSGSPDPVSVGDTLVYTISVANLGKRTATGVVVRDELPENVDFVTASSSQGSCSYFEGEVTCLIGELESGATASVTITVEVMVAGTFANTASATAAETDADPSNNETICFVTATSSGADLTGTWQGAFEVRMGMGSPQRRAVRGRIDVSNIGTANATWTNMMVYLSTDTVLDSADLLIARRVRTRPVNAGTVRSMPLNIQLPVGEEAVGKYLIAVLDAGEAVVEEDERNNIVVSDPVEPGERTRPRR